VVAIRVMIKESPRTVKDAMIPTMPTMGYDQRLRPTSSNSIMMGSWA
jgi:hypothetical protein